MAAILASASTGFPSLGLTGARTSQIQEKTMFSRPFHHSIAVGISMLSLSLGQAIAGGADDDLRQAAKLHKGGDTSAAVAIWKHWVGKGNVDAAYNLGVIHQHGDGVTRNYPEALRWYRLAAGHGDKVSQFQIGLMYQNGEGVEANAEEAHRWFTAHLQHHLHHDSTPQMQAWRRQAVALIDDRDRREALVASRANSAQVLADLKARAGMTAKRPLLTASGPANTTVR
jgi:hypothetical protein